MTVGRLTGRPVLRSGAPPARPRRPGHRGHLRHRQPRRPPHRLTGPARPGRSRGTLARLPGSTVPRRRRCARHEFRPPRARPARPLSSPHGDAEAADVRRTRELAAATPDPWLRSNPLHVTASAVIVHPDSGRVLLRWHQRQQAWLQVGGHGDPGESDPLAVALREAREETGLTDLAPWPDAELWQVAIVSVPANSKEPAHEHADVRFIFATPNRTRPGPSRPAPRCAGCPAGRRSTPPPRPTCATCCPGCSACSAERPQGLPPERPSCSPEAVSAARRAPG